MPRRKPTADSLPLFAEPDPIEETVSSPAPVPPPCPDPTALVDGCRIIWTDRDGREWPGIYRYTDGMVAEIVLDEGAPFPFRKFRIGLGTIRRVEEGALTSA